MFVEQMYYDCRDGGNDFLGHVITTIVCILISS